MNEETIGEWTKIEDLNPWKDNPRINQSAIDEVAKSIKRFGFASPIIARSEDKMIIAGHTRFEAAKKLGLQKVPVRLMNLDIGEAQLLALADNKIGEIADWDEEKLKAILSDLKDEDLAGLGWSDEELADLIDYEPQSELHGDPDEVPEVQEDAITQEGDLWILGNHRLHCGDSTKEKDVAVLMNGEKADMVHTDPPYNIDYTGGSKLREKIENDKLDNFNEFLIPVYKNISKSLVNGGAVYVWHAPSESYYFVSEYLKTDLLFKSLIVWNKNNSTFGRSDYHWKHELCLYGWKSGSSHKWFGDRKQTTVWDIERPSRSEEHPTMKPIELCLKAITNSSDKNMIVLDLFGGSGSTLIACEQTNRKCFMMELDPHYCDVIVRRWQLLTGKVAVNQEGQSFNELAFPPLPW